MSDTRTDIITKDVFISWTGQDKAIKDAVKAHLEDKGLTCTDSQIDCAGNYFEWSKQAATASHIAVLILTENSIKSSTYQKTELQEIVKVFGENFSNRLVTFCPNQAVYNLETFGENGESLLADNYNSAVFFGEEVTREALEDLATKVTNLLLGRTFEIYKAACEASEKKMGLLSFFVDRQQGNTSVDYDKIYVERNVNGGDGNELSAKELLASGDLLLVYGPSGMGKTEYIKQLRRAAAPEVLTVVVRCSDLWRSGKTVYGYLCENVASGVQNAAFTDKHFERLWSGRDRLVVFDGLDEVPTTATTDLFFQKISDFCRAKADGRRTQLIFTSRNKDDADRFADDSTDVKSRLQSFELQPLNDDQIEKLCASLAQVFGFDGDDFFYKIKRLDEEIKTNPLLVSQLAIIFKNEGSIPYGDMEMSEKLAEIIFEVEDKADVLDVKSVEIIDLRALVEAFAALQYEKPELDDAVVMRIALKQRDERAVPKHVLEYFKKRAIYVDGRFLHKSLGEFFAASEFAWRYQSEDTPQTVLDLVIRHCGDDSWGSVVNWFVRKTELKTLVIPDGVKRIGLAEFFMCGALTSVTIPSSVTSIGLGALAMCHNLVNIDVDKSNVSYHSNGNCLIDTKQKALISGCNSSIIPNDGSVTSIDDFAFYGYIDLRSIAIPDSVTSIGRSAFNGCVDLTSVTIGNGVTSIGSSAFAGCCGLTCIAIPDSVTSIGDWAFSGCSGLTSIVIPDNVVDIGFGAFSDCSGLTSVTIPDSVTSIGIMAFEDCNKIEDVFYQGDINKWLKIATRIDISVIVDKLHFSTLPKDGNLVIEDGITEIGAYALSGIQELESVTIPNSVTTIGSSAFEGCENLISVTIPDSVTTIGADAFSGCFALTNIIIPEGVKIIEGGVFSFSGLTDVTIPGSVTSICAGAFFGTSLKDIVFKGAIQQWNAIEKDEGWDKNTHEYKVYCNDGVLSKNNRFSITKDGIVAIQTGISEITHCMLKDLLSIKSVEIPKGVTSIGWGAFSGCSGLISVTIPDSVTSIGRSAFSGCSGLTSITIPDSVTSIGDWAFDGCSGLTSITIPFVGEKMDGTGNTRFDHIFGIDVPDSLKEVVITGGASIGDWAFSGCSGLKSITIPDSVTSIGEYAFSGCSGLKRVSIPDGITSIGRSAFSGCSGLTSVTIGTGVTSIGWGAFSGCSGLTSITIPFVGEKMDGTGNTRFDHIFVVDVPDSLKEVVITGGKDIDEMAFLGCSGLTNITIPDSVISIGDRAFFGCEDLTSVTIGTSVTSIGKGAFLGLSGLTSVIIPDSVTGIGNSAFLGCSGLTSVTIGNSVTNIGKWAFDECSGLTDITYHGTMSQWRAIEKASDWDKGTPDYKVYCTDGVLDKDDERNI